jgi:hypothetical protein
MFMVNTTLLREAFFICHFGEGIDSKTLYLESALNMEFSTQTLSPEYHQLFVARLQLHPKYYQQQHGAEHIKRGIFKQAIIEPL